VAGLRQPADTLLTNNPSIKTGSAAPMPLGRTCVRWRSRYSSSRTPLLPRITSSSPRSKRHRRSARSAIPLHLIEGSLRPYLSPAVPERPLGSRTFAMKNPAAKVERLAR